MSIPGVVESKAIVVNDNRGVFQKIHHDGTESTSWPQLSEVFLTKSVKGAIRGMHLQWGTHSARKFVKCIDGDILDVLVDLRPDSPTFQKNMIFELSGQDSKIISMPEGIAHGYQVLSPTATVIYGTDNAWCNSCDTGFQPLSFNFPWPIDEVVLSTKDLKLPVFVEFSLTLSKTLGAQH